MRYAFSALQNHRPRQIQRQQVPQYFFIGRLCRNIVPAVGGGDGFVQFLMRVNQPGGTGVVEIRQRALFQFGLKAGFGDAGQVAQIIEMRLCARAFAQVVVFPAGDKFFRRYGQRAAGGSRALP